MRERKTLFISETEWAEAYRAEADDALRGVAGLGNGAHVNHEDGTIHVDAPGVEFLPGGRVGAVPLRIAKDRIAARVLSEHGPNGAEIASVQYREGQGTYEVEALVEVPKAASGFSVSCEGPLFRFGDGLWYRGNFTIGEGPQGVGFGPCTASGNPTVSFSIAPKT